MTLPVNSSRRFLPLFLASVLAGCGSGEDEKLGVVVIGVSTSLADTGPRLGEAGRLIRAATAEGLVAFDESGRVIPALADRWIVTDDGLSYIFRLRDGTWPDGTTITGESARASLRQAMAALRGTPLARDLEGIDEIRTMAGRVVEIRLSSPNPDLLQILAQPELGLLRKGAGAGPMRLRRQEDGALLIPIPPSRRGLPDEKDWNERASTIRLSAQSAKRAIAAFREGEAEVLLGGSFVDFPLTGSLGLSRGSLTPDPVIGIFGFVVVNADGFLAAPENREAVAMAIDREALADALGVSGWVLSTRIVSPGTEGDLGTIGERWTAIAPARTEAAARVTRWRSREGTAPRLRIALPDGPGADLLFARLREDFRTVGLDASRVGMESSADLRLVDAVARYPRASWFLGQLSCAARRGLCSESADRLATQARAASDAASRSALLAEAEAELTAANVYIPIGVPLRWSLVRGNVAGFAPNRFAIHPLMPLAVLPR